MHLPVINCMIETVTQNKKGEIYVNLVGMGFNWNLKVSEEVDSTAIELKKVGNALVDFENKIDAEHIEWMQEDKETKKKTEREATFINTFLIPRCFISFTSDSKINSELYQVLSKFPVLKHRAAASQISQELKK